MKKTALILFAAFAPLFMTGCELPDIAGLNSMPKTTGEMVGKMNETNDAIHKQTLLLALTELNKRENQENMFPVPTGLMPAGQVFAETATPEELIHLTYSELVKLQENTLVTGFGDDGPTPLTEQDKSYSRFKKFAALSSLQVIAGFAQDEKVDEIIRHDIEGNSRFAEAGLAFLALRAYFIRDVLLKLSLKIDETSAKTLNNSGQMNEAIKYLKKLDKLSRLNFNNYPVIQLKLENEAAFTGFDENLTARRLETPNMWALAIQKAVAGSEVFKNRAVPGSNQAAEIAAQNQAIQEMRNALAAWKTTP